MKKTLMQRFTEWYKDEDCPVAAMSNKHLFWFVSGILFGAIVKLIQTL
jgi:hypothetical protein